MPLQPGELPALGCCPPSRSHNGLGQKWSLWASSSYPALHVEDLGEFSFRLYGFGPSVELQG